MLIRTTYEYDIKHTGDEMDRLEILSALNKLALMVSETDVAEVEIASVKSDLICVKIHTIDSP